MNTMIISIPKRLLLSKLRIQKLLPIRIARRCWTKDKHENGDILQITPEIKLEAVPAYNTTPGRDKFHPKGRDNGYILTVGDTRIYIAGDTENIPEMKQIKNIDIAFLPVNQPYTMTPEQAIQSAKSFNRIFCIRTITEIRISMK